MPPTAFLLSIAGLGISLAGFSGLVAALRRGTQWKPLDVYRLRQIPEMGLATSMLAMASFALGETIGSAPAVIRYATVVAAAFTLSHVVVLSVRARRMGIRLTSTNFWTAGILDIALIAVAGVSLWQASAASYEWLLILFLARPRRSWQRQRAGCSGFAAPGRDPRIRTPLAPGLYITMANQFRDTACRLLRIGQMSEAKARCGGPVPG